MKLDNYHAINSAYAYSLVEECTLYYDRRSTSPVVPQLLEPYVRGTHNLYLKQVPSCLTLRKAGSRIPSELEPILQEEGFYLPRFDDVGPESNVLEDIFSQEPLDHPTGDVEVDDVPSANIGPSATPYEDPWKVLAGYAFASQFMETRPKINVWAGGCHRLQGKIRPALCGSDRKNVTWFTQIHSIEEKLYLIFNHTHWGHRIQVARRSGTAGRPEDPLRFLAQITFRRISFFLNGRHDPLWSKSERAKFCDPSKRRNSVYRSQRLLEVLKTIDGLFLQRYLSYPEEVWNWEKYDVFVIQSLSILLTDEFIDGELTDHSVDEVKTHYEELKAARKLYKSVIHSDNPLAELHRLDDTPRWIQSFLRNTWNRAARHEQFSRLYLAGLLSQTRGSGTPPPLVVLRSKRKFLRSVQEAPPEMTTTQRLLVDAAMEDVLAELPDHIFTGLDSKARVTVTGAACWEHNRSEGGTAQAILDLMSRYDDIPIPIRDLDTGIISSFSMKEKFESLGTAVFYACLEEVVNTPVDELRKVHLTIVREPGKARVVTKGHAALKIVLDTVSKIVSYPLKKGIRSSESGMGKSHHGWNLFKDFTSEEMYELLFSENKRRRVDDVYADHIDRLTVWEDVFFSSTDYQEATDRMVHAFARPVASKWMRKCGIPQILQGIVLAVCFAPREVYFTATGPLSSIGLPVEGDTRHITLYRGVLMGDPLTKVVLHFANILTRKIADGLTSGRLFRHFRNGNECYDEFMRGMGLLGDLTP